MGRNTQLVLSNTEGKELAAFKVTYGTRLLVDRGSKVKRGQRLCEWDPYTTPIISELEGYAKYEDIVDGVSGKDVADEATGISNKVVVDWRASPRGTDLKPAIVLYDSDGKDGQVVKQASGADARYLLSVDAILSIEDGAHVKAGDVLARINQEGARTKDITGGLPRVAELFEARRPKDHAIIAEIDGYVEFGRDYKNKRRIIIRPKEEDGDTSEYLIQKGKHISVQEGDFIEKGEFLLDGNPAPHDILHIKGVEELANYLVQEVQEVYRLQGVKINDKHIEVIVRQMLQKVEIEVPGDSGYLIGEQVDAVEFEEVNDRVKEEGGTPGVTKRVLLGITKASLQTRSFISAASFQETTRVLTEAAVQGKSDTLLGLKENVIVGRLIPAGTGSQLDRFRHVATQRDDEILAEKAEAEEKAALEAAAAVPTEPLPSTEEQQAREVFP
jgi:DNA-directed RNA polymerase subunit beta'